MGPDYGCMRSDGRGWCPIVSRCLRKSEFHHRDFLDSSDKRRVGKTSWVMQEKVEGGESTGKISVQLADRFRQEWRWRVLLISRPPSIESDDGVSILKERDVANGAVD